MEQINYKKVFSQLSHIKALSHDHKFDQIIQNIITHSLYQNSNKVVTSEEEIQKGIFDSYGIKIRIGVVQSNVDKLLSKGDLIKDRATKRFLLSSSCAAKITERTESANVLENEV